MATASTMTLSTARDAGQSCTASAWRRGRPSAWRRGRPSAWRRGRPSAWTRASLHTTERVDAPIRATSVRVDAYKWTSEERPLR